MATAALITKPTFTLADRLKVQQELIRTRQYIVMGRLTAILFEGQRSTKGFSQSRPRYANTDQQKILAMTHSEALAPFSEKQAVLYQSISLDWLNATRG